MQETCRNEIYFLFTSTTHLTSRTGLLLNKTSVDYYCSAQPLTLEADWPPEVGSTGPGRITAHVGHSGTMSGKVFAVLLQFRRSQYCSVCIVHYSNLCFEVQ